MINNPNKPELNGISKASKKTSWNWYAAFFQGLYYAGKGNVKNGFIYTILAALPWVGWVIFLILFFKLGRKANSELAQEDFHWSPVLVVLVVSTIFAVLLEKI